METMVATTRPEAAKKMVAPQRREAIVVGGGQAGLSTAYELRRLGVDGVVLEAQRRVGDQWRRRWDSLHAAMTSQRETVNSAEHIMRS